MQKPASSFNRLVWSSVRNTAVLWKERIHETQSSLEAQLPFLIFLRISLSLSRSVFLAHSQSLILFAFASWRFKHLNLVRSLNPLPGGLEGGVTK